MSSFKHRPTKLKYRSDISTLDEFHKDLMKKMNSNYDKLEYRTKIGSLLVNYYDQMTKDQYNQNVEFKKQNEDTNDKDKSDIFFKNICNNDKQTDNVSDEDTKEISNLPSNKLKQMHMQNINNRKVKKTIKKRKLENNANNKSILNFMGCDNESEKSDEDHKMNRAELQDKYLFMVDKNYACGKVKTSKNIICSKCKIEKVSSVEDGCYICKKCGEMDNTMVEIENTNYRETNYEKTKYPYKKINHLKEKLNQFQSKETAEIPDYIYDIIYVELKKQRIDPKNCIPIDIKKSLKKNRETSYYEHIQQIYCKVSGSPPITLSRETENTIISMFQSMQESFQKYKKGRSNFLNYAYVLNKLFRICKLEKHSKFFYLLKSKDKLRDQDNIWKNICKDMNWDFHPS